VGLIQGVARVDHIIDQPDLQRFCRIKRSGEHQQLAGACCADAGRQGYECAHVPAQTDVDESESELCAAACDHAIARSGQRGARPDRGSINGCQHRLTRAPDGGDDAFGELGTFYCLIGGHALHRHDVTAGAKGRSCSRQHDGPNVGIGVGGLYCACQCDPQVHVDGVALRRPV
jgi:hypothetical protein